jgi:hypothetical protein
MARHLVITHTRPLEGKDAEFNDWYDNIHLAEVLKVEGFVTAQRYRVEPAADGALPELPYIAIYEVETESLSQTMAALRTASRSMDMGDSIDRRSVQQQVFTAI